VNDDLATIADLGRLFNTDGLQIGFDGPPEIRSITGATMIVTVEASVTLSDGAAKLKFFLDGTISLLSANVVSWKLDENSLHRFEEVLRESQPSAARVRVLLKGSTIWSGSGAIQIYLDGEAFGEPGLRADKKTPRTELIFPTGAGQKAGDFESWFYIALRSPTNALAPSLAEAAPQVIAAAAPAATAAVTKPATAAKRIVKKAKKTS
jgi:hypothetical protein